MIPIEIFATTGYLSAYNHTLTYDLDACSAVVASGGDGTLHEVVNGMMQRKDGKRIPVGFIPNGSGNDICLNLGIT